MNSVLIFVILAALVCLVMCDMSADRYQIIKACMDETRTTDADIKSFLTSGVNRPEVKENIKCNIKCVMEKNGHLRAGVFDDAAIMKELKDLPQLKNTFAETEAALKECKNVKGTNDCDYAFQIFMCLKDRNVFIRSYM